jgi:hypothetical protein
LAEPGFDFLGRPLTETLDRVGRDEPAGFHDRYAVGEALHLVQVMGGQEHGPPVGHDLADQPLELGLHERAQPRCRLVEDDQLGAVHEGEDQPDLLAVALGELLGGTVGHDPEPLRQLPGQAQVALPPGSREPVDMLLARHAGEQGQLTGEITGPAADLDAVLLRVKP